MTNLIKPYLCCCEGYATHVHTGMHSGFMSRDYYWNNNNDNDNGFTHQ